MTQQITAPLREDVRLLGNLLGETLKQHAGQDLFNQVEQIRALAKGARDGQIESEKQLEQLFLGLKDEEILPLTRAFSYFLNFANIAEQYHVVRNRRQAEFDEQAPSPNPLTHLFEKFKTQQIGEQQLFQQICDLNIELVLTAHPTEVSRRTLIQKYDDITDCLSQLDQQKLTPRERQQTIATLKQLVSSAWQTDEIRQHRPTPVDEAKWGFATIEQSLWNAVPQFIRELNELTQQHCQQSLPLDIAPIRFASWMGGDRDGNPNVTHQVTQEVLWLSRWQAADLYLRDIENLRWELSIQTCSEEMKQALGSDHPEPYREYLRDSRERLKATRHWLTQRLHGLDADDSQIIKTKDELLQPLLLCYRSLIDSNLAEIANGQLLDFIYRVNCFGIELLKLDIRQESGRHRQAISAITEYLGLGNFESWTEQARQNFLIQELQSKRPLLPKYLDEPEGSLIQHPDVLEVFATMRTLAEQPTESLGAYIISMAEYPSDVLAVLLLQKEAGIQHPLRVVPLFETLKDLDGAAKTMNTLFNMHWYKQHIQGRHEVMIGYSDSAKDAGFMSANWAQYRAQEELTAVAKNHGVQLTLFHGRGGSISRGGAPTQQALFSQPPGSISGAIRVTEQGEMIRFKFGLEGIALQNLEIYTAATLEATLLPPPEPKKQWRELMNQMTDLSVQVYRQTVRENPHFVSYLRTVTPELELQMLPLGSRPAKRKVSGGIESLRAIPWVFAWTQIRLMLPAWLGTGTAINQVHEQYKMTLDEMLAQWPYFQTLIDMLEMVLSKSDADIALYYESHLTQDQELKLLGIELRQRLQNAVDTLLGLKGESKLLSNNKVLDQSMQVRKPYLLPLHLLQAELMKRRRLYLAQHQTEHSPVDHALMVSIAGIAAGLRNTG
ncbi:MULTISPECIES: phosphoenolpyruvate carboxylase [unclassified Acinetobacter]|uniref:phosphoenolpyruvate carboxylase n=1 Tax=unclassified Acinetobacter TaxID=196816 RepID=UPI00244B1781|nr:MULTISPECIES: phosphoenolpyruvate carboxylase [unclassified Acinetobacter]MDH0032710.1 phosphoenolpyruvate carboxylase [Acinetobacter sp. GD04021]MDH0888145.1 phosphoenolpyruvate carboxylase [Acinetobacter sp. GD03873]MDH1084496.1 phosphoenolpyruvate carboxylase [Acinetobacter sp. GD03983]MDH2191462.1 phosphoenolpyruvate carboxylase [Acinetobacter sp. GD03645]MDH2205035.1 phosphoenolpyruvate carboxylase [Acinetobacter sp. GD03647]